MRAITERVVVQEIVFPSGIVLPAAFDAVLPLYLNDEESVGADIEGRRRLRVFDGGVASFDAYFNRLHAGYWARFGDLKTVFLELSTEGRGHLSVLRSTPEGKVLHVHSQELDPSGATSVSLDLAATSAGGTLWFELRTAGGDLVLREASWTTEPPGHHRDVVVDVAICTYERPEDVVGCLQGLIASEELRQSIHRVRVIDNGSNSFLDAPGGAEIAAVWGDQLETVYQQNLGGSGGFSRGMAEAVRGGAEGNLQHRLSEAVGAERNAHQGQVCTAGQGLGVHREYRQDQEQAKHAQSEDRRQGRADPALGRAHAVIGVVGHGTA